MLKKARLSGFVNGTVLSTGFALCLSIQAHAQTASDATVVAEDAVNRDVGAPARQEGDGEIVVTALRRNESLMKAPAAITAFDQKSIEESHIRVPSDYLALTPGVSFSQGETSGVGFITVRGVTQNRSGELPVAVVIDGVQQHLAQGFTTQLIDLKQIELLKGPQGALYGRNAAAGAIVITTLEPTDQIEGAAELEFGNGNSHNVRANIRGPIIEGKLRASVAVSQASTDGYIENIYLRQNVDYAKERSIRGALFWLPSEDLTIDIRGYHSDTKTGALNYVVQPVPDANSTSTPISSDILGYSPRHVTNGSIRIRYSTPIGLITSVTSGGEIGIYYTSSATPYFAGRPSPKTTNISQNYKDFGQELRLSSEGSSPLQYVVGASYYHKKWTVDNIVGADLQHVVLPGFQDANSINPTLTNLTDDYSTNAYAGFGQLDFRVSETFQITGAVRYDTENRATQSVGPASIVYAPAPYNSVFTNPFAGLRRTAKYSAWQPKFTVRYTPSERLTAYLSYGQGFRPGGFNPAGSALRANNPLVLDAFLAERNTSYEAGIKATLFDRLLSINAAIYHQDIENQQYYQFLVAANNSVLLNIDKVGVEGGEIEARLRIGPNFSLSGAYSVTHSKIKTLSLQPSLAGNHPPYVPRDQINISADHKLPINDSVTLHSHFDYVRMGKQYWDPQNSSPRDAIDLLSGRIAVEGMAGWSAYVWGRNLLDTAYNETYTAGGYALRATPRTYGAGVSYKF